MEPCPNCRSRYADDGRGIAEYHNQPCTWCASNGHSACQCVEPEESPAAAALRRLRAPHIPHGDSGDAA